MEKGETFNESVEMADSATGRFTRRVTRAGMYNETPAYHLNTAFSADSRWLVMGTAREGGSAITKVDVQSGEVTVLAVTDGVGLNEMSEGQELWAAGRLGGGHVGVLSAIVQASGWVLSVVGKSLLAVHMDTLEERVLIEHIGRQWRFGVPNGTIDGRYAIVTRVPEHPEIAAGKTRATKDYRQAVIEKFGGMPTTYLRVEIATGEVEEVFHEPVAGSHHVQPSPVDGDVWLIDRDWPPLFWCGGDHFKTSRCWLLNARSKALTEIAPRNAQHFATHTNWAPAGDRILYHGPQACGGDFIGVADTRGGTLWEMQMPVAYYGHACTHTMREAFVTDGLLSPDLVTAIHYRELDSAGMARVEVLARHNTQWRSMDGQYPHPHSHMSPDGEWLSYNRAESGRSDVYLVRVG